MAAEEEKSRSNTNLFILFLSLAVFIRSAKASWEDHRYNAGDPVPFFVNKVGPLNNPSETYWYYDLPFCRPDQVIKKESSLGEVLNGDRLTNAKYKLNFREDKDSESICKKTLSKEEVTKFRDAIKKDYYYQMYYDDLPLWGFVGKAEESMETMNETEPRYYLFNHIQFNVIFNQNQVIEISAFSDPSYVVNVTDNAETEAEFMYSVRWSGTPMHFGNRMDKYLKSSLLPHHLELHWFSIINSVVIVVLLIGFLVTTFFRTIKNDMIKYSQKDRQEDKEEVGWKNVHGDVFRYPPYKSLLCGVLGTGIQLLILVLFIFVLAFMGAFYPHNRGAMFSSLFIVYALTSVVAGYTSSSLHTQWGGMIPIKNMLLTLFLFPGPLFVIFSVLNTIAIIHNATAALPFGTILLILLVWILVTFPLLIAGHIFGRSTTNEFQAPCATKRIPTDIPPLSWYRRTIPQMFLAGFLPFSGILIELHYILTSLWGHKIYTIYSILFVLFIILIIATMFLSITFPICFYCLVI
eukprot:TRINITY_DN6159_c0_g1_i1.p1 TRINITY_DN6159_c0_g1~~TRINITY_DN6159_c0_g1_i1.p1  ORF type:complete len:549 (-),score=73.91 TRINITY_DN6159_c0_g1_i1:1483-3045(-)